MAKNILAGLILVAGAMHLSATKVEDPHEQFCEKVVQGEHSRINHAALSRDQRLYDNEVAYRERAAQQERSLAEELTSIPAALFLKTVSEKLRYSTEEVYQLFSKKIKYAGMNVDPKNDSYLRIMDIIKVVTAFQSPFEGHETPALQSLQAGHWMSWLPEILPIACEKLSRITSKQLSRIRGQKVFEIIKPYLAEAEFTSNSGAFCQAMQWWYEAQTGLHYEQ